MSAPVEHLIFLIHPCCYEPIEADRIRREGMQLFLEREEEVKARWLADLAGRGEGTLFAQLGGPDYLRGAAADSLGEGGALLLRSPFPESGDLGAYYRRLKDELLEHLRRHDRALDPAAATSVTVAMKEWINRWVRGVGTGMDEFRAVVEAARLAAP